MIASTIDTTARTRAHFDMAMHAVTRRTDRMFVGLLIGQWVAAIVVSVVWSPYEWAGWNRSTHVHVYAAAFLGFVVSAMPIAMTYLRPGWIGTRMVIAVAQMLWSALLIHLTGGRIETHFHVFGSLAFLSFYRDWRVLVPASLIVVVDHLVRGMFWPESVYGIANPSWWRFLEHAFWVVFIDVFLFVSCMRAARDTWRTARHCADVELLSSTLEQRVEDRTAQLEVAQRIARVGDWSLDLASGEVVWSNELYRIFGVDRGSYQPSFSNTISRLHDDDRARVEGIVSRAKRDRLPFAWDGRIVRANGDVRYVSCEGHTDFDSDGRPAHMLGTLQDVTERRALESKLRNSEKLSAIGQLAAGLAHEINNPIGVILGFAQGVERLVGTDDRLTHPIASITREARRCKALVQELLTFSRVAKKTAEQVDLNRIVRATAVLLESRAKSQGVELVQELDEQALTVFASPTQLQQILVNLGTNALDAMADGGVLRLRTGRSVGRGAVLEVIDNGSGIPDDIRSRVFEPFFTTKDVGQGTGLGLALVSEIVQQHGGSLDLRSASGSGTTVSVSLPIVVPVQAGGHA